MDGGDYMEKIGRQVFIAGVACLALTLVAIVITICLMMLSVISPGSPPSFVWVGLMVSVVLIVFGGFAALFDDWRDFI